MSEADNVPHWSMLEHLHQFQDSGQKAI